MCYKSIFLILFNKTKIINKSRDLIMDFAINFTVKIPQMKNAVTLSKMIYKDEILPENAF